VDLKKNISAGSLELKDADKTIKLIKNISKNSLRNALDEIDRLEKNHTNLIRDINKNVLPSQLQMTETNLEGKKNSLQRTQSSIEELKKQEEADLTKDQAQIRNAINETLDIQLTII